MLSFPDTIHPTADLRCPLMLDADVRQQLVEPGFKPFPSLWHRNVLQEMLEIPVLIRALRVPTGGSILEIGCGHGIALPVLSARLRPERLVGIDVDRNALNAAAAHLARQGVAAELYAADARALPFDAGSFDLVVDFGTCYHINDPERALREIARVLASGGLFISETLISQFLSHPLCRRDRRLPWHDAPELVLYRHAVLWKSLRRKEQTGSNARPIRRDRLGRDVAMFGEGHRESIVQRGIDEVLACRDLVEAAPNQATLLERLLARIASAAWPTAPTPVRNAEPAMAARPTGPSNDR